MLSHCLVDDALGQAIIFTATKRDAESLAEDLEADGHSAVALHGDLKQSKRTQMLNKLRRGEAKVLVATDVAARGLDVPAITHVFNFDLPRKDKDQRGRGSFRKRGERPRLDNIRDKTIQKDGDPL